MSMALPSPPSSFPRHSSIAYLILLPFERFVLGILGGDLIGAVVVGIDNV